jgi:glycosyltransferase involved in cell wall biosynthesis
MTLPRVSMVVLAFNQESFVEDAIAAAIAQDYPNLQIVLSDDGSSDATFAIMERAGRDYKGPHSIEVTRTPANRGIVQHFYHAFTRCDGALIVAAAGDDISLPHRVSTLVKGWQASDADAIFSDFEIMEADGSFAAETSPKPLRRPQTYFPDLPINPILGVSAAYSRRVFEMIVEPTLPVFAEDAFFFMMLGFRSRKVTVLDDVLVRYRRHGNALTHRVDLSVSLEDLERSAQSFAARAVELLRYFEQCVVEDSGYRTGFGSPARVDLDSIRSDIAFGTWQARWIEAPAWLCVRETIRHFNLSRARWLLPRAFGLVVLKTVKGLNQKRRTLLRDVRR